MNLFQNTLNKDVSLPSAKKRLEIFNHCPQQTPLILNNPNNSLHIVKIFNIVNIGAKIVVIASPSASILSIFDIFHLATVIATPVTIFLWVIFRWDVGVALAELCELLGSLPRQGSLIFQGFFMIMFHPYSWEYLFPILLRLQLLRLLSRACSDPEVRGESLLHEAPMVKIPLVQVFTFFL